MPAGFKFSKAAIDDHLEKIGVDVRPPIEIGMEQTHITDFYRSVSEKYPDLFESLAMSRSEFRILKKFEFPGKGRAELPTFELTKRGPVFTIPRRLAVLDGETDLPQIDDRIVEILKLFREAFPRQRTLRVGKIHEYMFDCGPRDSKEFVVKRFTRVSEATDATLKFNLATSTYNRMFEIQAAEKHRPGTVEKIGFGIRVKVDFNNLDMSKPLEDHQILGILHDAQEFNDQHVMRILNGEGIEE